MFGRAAFRSLVLQDERYARETAVLALTFSDRDSIIAALDDPPPGLEELRGVLLREREWRVREELV
jgi:hypothetical protein